MKQSKPNSKNFTNKTSQKKGKKVVDEKVSQTDSRYRDRNDKSRIGSKESKSYDNMCTNDIGWYNRVLHLYNDATRIPFALIQGKPDPAERQFGDTYEINPSLAVPGIMTIEYVPGIGISEDSTSAANRAFQNIFAEITAKTTSGNVGFLPANLGLIITVEQSIAQNIAVAKRALKSVMAYHGINVYYPRALLKAQGFDFTEINSNIANYRWRLNNIIRNYNSLFVPNFIDTFKRQYFLAANIFADGSSAYSQLYLFKPDIAYYYNDTGLEVDGIANGIARAVAVDIDYELSFDEFLDSIEQQLDSLRGSSDWSLVNGTLLRTYNDSQFIRIDELGDVDTLTILNDPVMAYQIHNMTVAGKLPPSIFSSEDRSNCRDIYADYVDNAILYTPKLHMNQFQHNRSLGQRDSFVLNTFEDSVDPSFIMESTRLMTDVANAVTVSDSVRIISCGTEFVSGVSIINIADGDPSNLVNEVDNITVCNSVVNYGTGTGVTDYLNMRFVLALDKFHKAPRFTIIYGGAEDTPNVLGVTGDLYYYTTIPVEQVHRLHDTALLSIFAAHD